MKILIIEGFGVDGSSITDITALEGGGLRFFDDSV